jgi:hypothetical protein
VFLDARADPREVLEKLVVAEASPGVGTALGLRLDRGDERLEGLYIVDQVCEGFRSASGSAKAVLPMAKRYVTKATNGACRR